MASFTILDWFKAVNTGNYEYVLSNLTNGAKSRSENDDTGLIIAARRNDSRMVQILVEVESGLTNSAGDSALITSIRHDHVYVCRILVEREYKLRTIDGLTPLMVAVQSSSISCLPYLFPYLSFETDHQGRTALDHAVIQRKFSCVMYLLNHKLFTRRDLEHAMELAVSLGTLYTKDILQQHLDAGEYLTSPLPNIALPCQKPSLFGDSVGISSAPVVTSPESSEVRNERSQSALANSTEGMLSSSLERSGSANLRGAKHVSLRSSFRSLDDQNKVSEGDTSRNLQEIISQQNNLISDLKAQVYSLTEASKRTSTLDYERIMNLITKYQQLKIEHKKHMKECTKVTKFKRPIVCDAEIQCRIENDVPSIKKPVIKRGSLDVEVSKIDSVCTDSKNDQDVAEPGPIIYSNSILSHSGHTKKNLSSREKLKMKESVARRPSSNPDIQRLRMEAADLKRQICTLQTANNSLQSQLLDTRNQVHKLTTQNTSLSIKIIELEKQLAKREKKDPTVSPAQATLSLGGSHANTAITLTPLRHRDATKGPRKRSDAGKGDSIQRIQEPDREDSESMSLLPDVSLTNTLDEDIILDCPKSNKKNIRCDMDSPMTIEELGNRLFETYESVTKNDELHQEIIRLQNELQRMQLISLALLNENKDELSSTNHVLQIHQYLGVSDTPERTYYINKVALHDELSKKFSKSNKAPKKELDSSEDPCPKDERGNTPLMLAIYNNDIESLNRHIGLAGQTNNDGNTALMLAALMNRHRLVPALVEKEAMMKRHDGETALSLALQEEHYEVAKILKDYEGVPLNIPFEHTNMAENRCDRFTELIQATEEDDIITVWSYLDVQHGLRDEEGRTALMHAAECDSVGSLILLLPYERRLGDIKGRTALMHAAINGNDDCVELLKEEEGRRQDVRGWTALMYATQERAYSTVKRLAYLEAGIKTDDHGYTALIMAIQLHDELLVEILAEYEREICDSDGLSPLDWIEREAGKCKSKNSQEENIYITMRKVLVAGLSNESSAQSSISSTEAN